MMDHSLRSISYIADIGNLVVLMASVNKSPRTKLRQPNDKPKWFVTYLRANKLKWIRSGWGSMLPTVVVANMQPSGPSARCGNLNIGDQIISVNGISMVGLSLVECQNQIKVNWRTNIEDLGINKLFNIHHYFISGHKAHDFGKAGCGTMSSSCWSIDQKTGHQVPARFQRSRRHCKFLCSIKIKTLNEPWS